MTLDLADRNRKITLARQTLEQASLPSVTFQVEGLDVVTAWGVVNYRSDPGAPAIRDGEKPLYQRMEHPFRMVQVWRVEPRMGEVLSGSPYEYRVTITDVQEQNQLWNTSITFCSHPIARLILVEE